MHNNHICMKGVEAGNYSWGKEWKKTTPEYSCSQCRNLEPTRHSIHIQPIAIFLTPCNLLHPSRQKARLVTELLQEALLCNHCSMWVRMLPQIFFSICILGPLPSEWFYFLPLGWVAFFLVSPVSASCSAKHQGFCVNISQHRESWRLRPVRGHRAFCPAASSRSSAFPITHLGPPQLYWRPAATSMAHALGHYFLTSHQLSTE